MKTKKIFNRLEQLFNINSEQQSKTKALKAITELIFLLEKKEKKFRSKIEAMEADTEIPKYRRKLNLTEKHIDKAKAYKLTLEPS